MPAKNICPDCGGKLLVEAFGSYGDIYRMKKDGSMNKKRLRRRIYGGTDSFLIYCEECGKTMDLNEYNNC